VSVFLLDSNAVIALINQTEVRVARVVERHRRADIVTSSVVIHELCFGAYKSMAPAKNLRLIEQVNLTVLPFEPEDGREAGRVRALLAMRGTPIGPYDVLIAGQALARGLVLVTHNVREFGRVPGLKVEDWQA
jgi:tRNA(fMet)-specific endonuclease VapC